jgi:hypothetical protein
VCVSIGKRRCWTGSGFFFSFFFQQPAEKWLSISHSSLQ